MPAVFYAKSSFVIPNRRLFVISGNILSGIVNKGMTMKVRLNSTLAFDLPIESVEMVTKTAGSEVGLCALVKDADELSLLQGLMTEHATTLQGLVVSAASVIDRMGNGNGGSGWDESCEEEYVAPLKEHLPSPDVFSSAQCSEILAKLDEIADCGRENLKRSAAADLRDEETTLLFPGDAPDYVVLRTVDWCLHHPDPIAIKDEEEYHGHD